MQAIITKYLGPTKTKRSRVKAACQAKTIFVGWDHAMDFEGNHAAAAKELASRLGWLIDRYGTLESGCLPSGEYAHVFVKGE